MAYLAGSRSLRLCGFWQDAVPRCAPCRGVHDSGGWNHEAYPVASRQALSLGRACVRHGTGRNARHILRRAGGRAARPATSTISAGGRTRRLIPSRCAPATRPGLYTDHVIEVVTEQEYALRTATTHILLRVTGPAFRATGPVPLDSRATGPAFRVTEPGGP